MNMDDDTSTFYVAALDQLGRSIGLYIGAADFDEAYDRALEHEDVSVVQAVQELDSQEASK